MEISKLKAIYVAIRELTTAYKQEYKYIWSKFLAKSLAIKAGATARESTNTTPNILKDKIKTNERNK